MGLRRFHIIKTGDQDLQLIQQQVKETLDALVLNPTNSASLLSKIALVAGTNLVAHGLGRKYLSFFTGRFSAASTVTEGISPDPSKWIAMIATAPCTCDVLVL